MICYAIQLIAVRVVSHLAAVRPPSAIGSRTARTGRENDMSSTYATEAFIYALLTILPALIGAVSVVIVAVAILSRRASTRQLGCKAERGR